MIEPNEANSNPQESQANEFADGAVYTDEQIITQVLEGNTFVFELLMRRHNQRLFRLARSVVGEESEAEDVVQESFVRAYGALAKFEGRSSFSTWVTRITYHEALRSRRKRKRAAFVQTEMLGHAAGDLKDNQVDKAINESETRKMLTQAFDKLSTTHRTVLMLRLIEGLSTRETAECLRVSEGNVKVLLHRAKAQLVEAIEERAIPELKEQFSFAGDRCDRIVAGVFVRLGIK